MRTLACSLLLAATEIGFGSRAECQEIKLVAMPEEGRILDEGVGWYLKTAFNHDGSQILSGGDGLCNLWIDLDSMDGSGNPPKWSQIPGIGKWPELSLRDASSGRTLRSLVGFRGDITAATFSGDGSLIATAEFAVYRARLKEYQENKVDRRPRGDAVSFGDRNLLMPEGDGALIRIWDASTGRELKTLGPLEHPVACLAAGPKYVTAFDRRGKIHVWDRESWKKFTTYQVPRPIPAPTEFFGIFQVSPDGRRAASVRDKGLDLWDIDGKTLAVTLPGLATTLAFDGASRRLATFLITPDFRENAEMSLEIWDLDKNRRLRSLPIASKADSSALAFSPDGSRIAVGTKEGEIFLVGVSSGRVVKARTKGEGMIRALSFAAGRLRVIQAANQFGSNPMRILDYRVE